MREEHIFLCLLLAKFKTNQLIMSSTAAVVSPVGLQRFTLFTSLPPEIRVIIWRLSLSTRIVEILASNICTTGFYSQAALPVALHVTRESRQAVEAFYPSCFGSFLQPERVRFNFDLDILYLDMSQEEDGLRHFFGIAKEIELARLKYVSIDEGYLGDNMIDLHLVKTGLKRALKAMTNLKEMIVVRDITTRSPNYSSEPAQIKFYTEHKTIEAEEGWPADVEELPEVEKEYRNWKVSNVMKMTAVYGWRALRGELVDWESTPSSCWKNDVEDE